MSKNALCTNKLERKKERLIKRLCKLRSTFQDFKTEVDLELADISLMAEELNKSLSDIDIVLTKPKKERQDTLTELQSVRY